MPKIHELFANPANWTKGGYAKDQQSHEVPIHDAFARCFCLVGGVEKCYPSKTGQYNTVLATLADGIRKSYPDFESDATGGEGFFSNHDLVVSWNDHRDRTIQEVQQLVTALDV